jgi:MFS family permease
VVINDSRRLLIGRCISASNVGLFIPRFSDTLGGTAGAGLLSAFNVSCIIAQVLWGHLSDVSQWSVIFPRPSFRPVSYNLGFQRIRPSSAMALSSAIGSLIVLTLWGFAGGHGLSMLVPFSVLFGVASGGFSSMWSQSAYQIVGNDKEQLMMLISGECGRLDVFRLHGHCSVAHCERSRIVPQAFPWQEVLGL